MSAIPQTPRRDYVAHPDGNFVDEIYLRTPAGAALSLSGKELLVYIWLDGAIILTLTDGSGLTIGGAETIPVLAGQASLGEGTLVTLLVTEAQIQANLPSRGAWEYELVLRDTDDSDPEVLMAGQIRFQAGRPRP